MSVKKVLASIASYALVGAVALGVGGTLAGLQETKSAENTFTTEGIDIEQYEYQRKTDDNGKFIRGESYTMPNGKTYQADVMEKFSHNKVMIPVTESVYWEDRDADHMQPWAEIGAPGSNQLFDEDIAGVVDKFVFVKNTGGSPCYYRTVIAVEAPVGANAAIKLNRGTYSAFDWNQEKEGNQHGDGERQIIENVVIDGVNYSLYVATYTEPLAPGEISRPSLLQAYMEKEMNNESYKLFGDEINILVATQATQTGSVEGKTDAQTILEEAFGGPISATNHPWMNADGTTEVFSADTSWYYDDPTADVFTINGADELIGLAELVNSGTDTFVGQTINLDANISLAGYDWEPIGQFEGDAAGKWGTTFQGTFDGNNYTISNMTVNNKKGAGLFGKVKGTIKNVVVENADITTEHYAGGIVGHTYGSVYNCTVKDSTITCVEAVENPADGDKAGAIVGWIGESSYTISGCSAENVEITANRDAGQIVGLAWNNNTTVTDNTVKNVKVTYSGYGTGANINNEPVGRYN